MEEKEPMKEKKEKEAVKIRLSTAILLFLILALTMGIVFMYFYYNKKDNSPICGTDTNRVVIPTITNNQDLNKNQETTNTMENSNITPANTTVVSNTLNNANSVQTSKEESLSVDSDLVKKVYKYIPAIGDDAPNAIGAYQDIKTTIDNMKNNYLLAYAFTQLELSKNNTEPFIGPEGNKEGGFEEGAKHESWYRFKAELLQTKVKEIYGTNLKNENFDLGRAEYCSYGDDGYYNHSQGGDCTPMVYMTRNIEKAYKDDENLYIEDTYLAIQNNDDDQSLKLYTSANCTKLVESLGKDNYEKLHNDKLSLDDIAKTYKNKMVRYKHTFKKAQDGSYYWYSTEQM